ncbi:MAG: hypothetical protein ACK559_04865, partial [bacterium]
MLAGVDLDLHPQRPGERSLRREAVDQVDSSLLEVALRRAQPRVEGGAHPVEGRPDGLRAGLHEVD